jgi:hypothetical protein
MPDNCRAVGYTHGYIVYELLENGRFALWDIKKNTFVEEAGEHDSLDEAMAAVLAPAAEDIDYTPWLGLAAYSDDGDGPLQVSLWQRIKSWLRR